MAKLTSKKRNALSESTFALPGRRYPINDANHARNALARVSGNGSPAEKAKVRAAVHRKFPAIGKMHAGGVVQESGLYEMKEGEHVIPAKPDAAMNQAHTKELGVSVPTSTEEARKPMLETVSSTPNAGCPTEAWPSVDAGHDAGCGHWEGDGLDVKWHKS